MSKKETEKEFEKQVTEYTPLIYKVCSLYAHTDQDKQDLLQEILIQLWRSYQTFKGASRFSTWVYRVALNTAIAGLRKKKHVVQSYDPNTLPTDLLDIEYNKQADENLQQLYLAIDQLNQTEKALVLLYLEDKSYEEMEEIMGISQGTLRVKMNRIKDKLRKLSKN